MLRALALICLLVLAGARPGHADPWLAPGDEGLRADIQLLADGGILRAPVSTWPMSWPDIARDVLNAEERGLDDATANALLRVRRLARQASSSGYSGVGVRLSAAHEPPALRGFADQPREAGELAARASWLTEHVAVNLQGAFAADPEDEKSWRPDGSYLGVNFGNFMLSAGYMERWWGPGWDGSLILSTNARPIPTITLERNYTDPFKTPLLSWLGHWRASIAMGQMETRAVPVPEVRFFAARVNFKPRPWLEFGLTRTAQWCGGDRPCDWGTFTDMFLGDDNTVEGGDTADQPGNQMAGYDMRLRSPWRKLPLVFHTQWIGEDEAGGLPSKFLGQFGLETWGSAGWGGWRARIEYADTACNFARESPEFDCGYRNAIYPQGYAYRGRVIGHAMDNDSRMYSLGGIFTLARGDVVSLTLRRVESNRDGGGGHALGEAPLDLDNVEFRYSRGLGLGKIVAGIGYTDPAIRQENSSLNGYVTWQQGF